MRNPENSFSRWWFISLVLLLLLSAPIEGCGRGSGENAADEGSNPQVFEPYTGPCPEGQSSWDCMAWDQHNWE